MMGAVIRPTSRSSHSPGKSSGAKTTAAWSTSMAATAMSFN